MPSSSALADKADFLKLRSAAEWTQLCSGARYPMTTCMQKLAISSEQTSQIADNFVYTPPSSPDQLQTRSGVYFDPAFNNKILRIRDKPMKATIFMKSGLECLAFATHGGHMEHLGDKGLNSFIRQTLDQPNAYAIKICTTWIGGKPAILFEKNNGGLQGAYIQDPDVNAGIWAACKNPGPGVTEEGKIDPNVEEFVSSITGSSKFFY